MTGLGCLAMESFIYYSVLNNLEELNRYYRVLKKSTVLRSG